MNISQPANSGKATYFAASIALSQMQIGHGSLQLRVANRVNNKRVLFANLSRWNSDPPGSESRILRRGHSSNSNLVRGLDSYPDFAPAHLDNGDRDGRFYENAFANLAAQNKHLTPP